MPTLTANEIARLFHGAAAGLGREMEAAAEEGAAAAEIAAVGLSSGPYTSRMLRALGHPYARRNPRPPGDPATINVQSGLFRSSWRREGPERQGGRVTARLVNDAPYAHYLRDGTRFLDDSEQERGMIARPILERIEERVKPEFAGIAERRFRRLLGE